MNHTKTIYIGSANIRGRSRSFNGNALEHYWSPNWIFFYHPTHMGIKNVCRIVN